MGIFELFLLAAMLSADAFAVAVCKGLALCRINLKNCLWVGLWFGAFQALMPAIGFFAAVSFEKYVNAFSHWIAFVLLAIIGINMLKEAKESCSCETSNAKLNVKEMLILAVATSIDALAAGVSFAMIKDFKIGYAVLFIGAITFILSAVGVKVGSVFGTKYNVAAQRTGGVVLILLGIKIVLEHYGFWF